jgi:hypothetical protein
MRKETKITVFKAGQPSTYVWPPREIDGFIRWFIDTLEKVPEKYRSVVHVSIDAEMVDIADEVETPYPTLEIYYWRPETDAEEKFRISQEALETEEAFKQELRTLELLMRKYPNFKLDES